MARGRGRMREVRPWEEAKAGHWDGFATSTDSGRLQRVRHDLQGTHDEL
eukprot:CAMPEP_0117596958 /NCGR_PEP_ID=MMETSP0784-20121206/74595_1 /TAXON_ID=39447 /ORGANISM="" /LENGTH=48 /DNA_ID= /DNA_START= /DNA_END= /DNA_ORIENTATION=